MRGEAELTKALGERVVRVEARASTAEKAVGRRALPVRDLARPVLTCPPCVHPVYHGAI